MSVAAGAWGQDKEVVRAIQQKWESAVELGDQALQTLWVQANLVGKNLGWIHKDSDPIIVSWWAEKTYKENVGHLREWIPRIGRWETLAIAALGLTACGAAVTPQPPTIEVTNVVKATETPRVSETPTSTLVPTFTATAIETSTLVPTETPILPLPAFLSDETIGDGTVLFPILRAPLPPELSTFIPVDGKLTSGGEELTGLSGVKLCLGVESDETCYGVRTPAPEFLSRHLDGRVVTYQHDRDASQDGVQIYTTSETGEGITPQQVFINRVPMRPGLHFETVVRDGSDQNDPGAGQLLMTWIDTDKMKVVDELAQVRDFDSRRGDTIEVDYTNGVVLLTTFANNTKLVEEFPIGKPRYPTVTPRPEPTRTPVPPATETSVPPTDIPILTVSETPGLPDCDFVSDTAGCMVLVRALEDISIGTIVMGKGECRFLATWFIEQERLWNILFRDPTCR